MKNALNAYAAGVKKSGLFFRLVLFMYAANLLLGLTVALPFLGRLQAEFGTSMLPETFRQGFDFTALMEILRHFSRVLATLLAQAWWVVLLYLLLGIFFSGGILSALRAQAEKPSIGEMLNGGLNTFFRFLKLFVYMGVCHLLAALIVYLPLFMMLKSMYETVESEATLFYVFMSGVGVHLLLLVLLLTVSVYAKIRIIQMDSRKVFLAVIKSFAFVFRRFLTTFFLMLMLGLTAIMAGAIFWLPGSCLDGFGTLTLLLLFLVQQAYLFIRVWLRVLFLVSQADLYARYFPGSTEQAAYDWV